MAADDVNLTGAPYHVNVIPAMNGGSASFEGTFLKTDSNTVFPLFTAPTDLATPQSMAINFTGYNADKFPHPAKLEWSSDVTIPEFYKTHGNQIQTGEVPGLTVLKQSLAEGFPGTENAMVFINTSDKPIYVQMNDNSLNIHNGSDPLDTKHMGWFEVPPHSSTRYVGAQECIGDQFDAHSAITRETRITMKDNMLDGSEQKFWFGFGVHTPVSCETTPIIPTVPVTDTTPTTPTIPTIPTVPITGTNPITETTSLDGNTPEPTQQKKFFLPLIQNAGETILNSASDALAYVDSTVSEKAAFIKDSVKGMLDGMGLTYDSKPTTQVDAPLGTANAAGKPPVARG